MPLDLDSKVNGIIVAWPNKIFTSFRHYIASPLGQGGRKKKAIAKGARNEHGLPAREREIVVLLPKTIPYKIRG